jgi:hypothetical protein
MGIGLPGELPSRVMIFRDMVVWLPCSWMRSLMDLRAPFVLLLLIILPMPSSPPAGANTGKDRSNEGAGWTCRVPAQAPCPEFISSPPSMVKF